MTWANSRSSSMNPKASLRLIRASRVTQNQRAPARRTRRLNPVLSASKTLLIVPNSHLAWMCRARYQSPRRTRPIARAENALIARKGRRACRPRVLGRDRELGQLLGEHRPGGPRQPRLMSSARFFAVSMILPASSRCLGSGPGRGRNSNILGMLLLPSRSMSHGVSAFSNRHEIVGQRLTVAPSVMSTPSGTRTSRSNPLPGESTRPATADPYDGPGSTPTFPRIQRNRKVK